MERGEWLMLLFITIVFVSITTYASDRISAGKYCLNKYPTNGSLNNSIGLYVETSNWNWYCVEPILECKYGKCKQVDTKRLERVPPEAIEWLRTTK